MGNLKTLYPSDLGVEKKLNFFLLPPCNAIGVVIYYAAFEGNGAPTENKDKTQWI